MTTACRVYRGYRNANGYARVPFGAERRDALGRRRGRAMVLLHRWIVEQVEGVPLADGEVVMHTCDTPGCFLYEHLRRATQADNVADCEAKGRGRRVHGRGHPHAKLTDEQARAIATRSDSVDVLAAEFAVSPTLVRKIKAGEAWIHATGVRRGR